MLNFSKNIYKADSAIKPELRFVFFHHAGGSAANYFDFYEYFPKSWEVCFVELPGRGSAISQNLIHSRDELKLFLKKIYKFLMIYH